MGDGLTDLELGQVRVGLVEVEVLELEPRQGHLRRVRHLVGRLHDREVHVEVGLKMLISLFWRAGTSWLSSEKNWKTILFSLPGVPQ